MVAPLAMVSPVVANAPLFVQPSPTLKPELLLVPPQEPLMAPSQDPLMVPPFAMARPMVPDVPVLSRRCWRSMTCGQEGVGEAHGGIYRHNQQQPHRVLIMSFVTSV